MSLNVLVTGASGYIGGSIVAEILSLKRGGTLGALVIHAAVRSLEQAQSLTKLDVNVFQLNLSDETAVTESLLSNDIDLVINNATCIDPQIASSLISGLQKQREATGREVFFVQTTGLSAFDENTNWPFGEVKDTDNVYGLERQSRETYVVREVDTFVIEQTKKAGVTGFLIFPPTLHGRGSGTWNQLSPQIPALIQASINHKQVYKFGESRDATLAHVSDVAKFYGQLIEAIFLGKKLPAGEDGHYFLVSHVVSWWDIMDRLAANLHERGLVTTASTKVWPSDEMAAESVGVPTRFAHSIWNSSPKVLCEKATIIGWKPVWTGESFLNSLYQEVDDFLELGLPKSSLLHSLKPVSGHDMN
ncbi:hypothetical protein N7481_002577 [Penicillium waksmanii]|uniref:uncharacterized protein n=1 Tax=Penicillium waksmanii TaxID=69791 RepID=UPI002548F18D|nr:uncharacterized protein N7481_002577 [Penicillium waksmanii]KAJ5995600.1 hypothetical protein N7481_002577 [Penicillium waksmanii]